VSCNSGGLSQLKQTSSMVGPVDGKYIINVYIEIHAYTKANNGKPIK
jgi:hypothetical protein